MYIIGKSYPFLYYYYFCLTLSVTNFVWLCWQVHLAWMHYRQYIESLLFKRLGEMRKLLLFRFFSSYIALRGHTYLFSVHRLSIVKRRDCRRISVFSMILGTFTKSRMACRNVSHIWHVGDRRFHRGKCENAPELIYSNFMLINSYVIYCLMYVYVCMRTRCKIDILHECT